MKHMSKTAIIVTSALFLSCNAGEGNGFVKGSVSLDSCNIEDDDFDLNVNYYTATYFENTLFIRLQRDGDMENYSDGVFIEIRDVDLISENYLGAPLSIDLSPPLDTFMENGPTTAVGAETGYPLTPHNSPARATFYLNKTCPGNRLGFTDGTGTITFDKIYRPGDDKHINGSFSLTFVDPRSWEVAGEVGDTATLTGEFRFTYDRNASEQPFL